MRIGIVGGGFTGTMVAAQLMRAGRSDLEVVLFERRGDAGPGLAYQTTSPSHLLNVRASNMSAFPDDADHFVRWLEARGIGEAASRGFTFVARSVYGEYLRDVLAHTERSAAGRLRTVSDHVVSTRPTRGGVDVGTEAGETVRCDRVVLAVGQFPPAAPRFLAAFDALENSPRCVFDPWGRGGLTSIPADDSVLLLGTGLTMVDAALALVEQGHRGPIVAVSRHGILPTVHAPVVATHAAAPIGPASGLRELLRSVRSALARVTAAGGSWREVIDGMRPQTHAIWSALPPNDRRRFLRHLRAYWEAHRHRLAPAVAAQLDHLRSDGRLEVLAARITHVAEQGEALRVQLRARGQDDTRTLRVQRLVLCTGAESDYARIRQPLVRHLLDTGVARPDPLRLGLLVDERGALIDIEGRTSDVLFTAGPPTRGRHWEITAVPEIRTQCAHLAATLLSARRASESDRTGPEPTTAPH